MPIPVCLHQYLWTYTGYKFLWGDFSWLSKVFCYKMIPFPQWHCYRFSNWLWINDAVFLFLDIRTQEDLETENPEIFQTLKRETFVLMILMITKAMNNLLLKFLIFKESVPKLIPNIFLILWGKLSCEKDIYLLRFMMMMMMMITLCPNPMSFLDLKMSQNVWRTNTNY